ncbi:MAG: hypothetical protein CM1200mP14_12180 [Gammaproteobacteria bacterium]|nr:MAG: hypothetical protein CM1200mP14_12180 [Gammaproteobacteria bacterium]
MLVNDEGAMIQGPLSTTQLSALILRMRTSYILAQRAFGNRPMVDGR